MRKATIGTHKIEMFDAIDELPIVRFHKYQKFVMVDSGIGSTIEDFDRKTEKMRRYLLKGDTDNCRKELENLRQCVYMIQVGLSPQHLAFAALVTAIDGKPCDDITDDGLQKICGILNDAPNGELTDLLESVKKKIDDELKRYFPKVFEDGTAKEYFELMRRRTLLVLNNIVAGNEKPDATEDVEKITTELITYSNPRTFNGAENAEIQFDRQFENLCIILSSNLNVRPKEYSVLEFYNAFEFLKEKASKEQEAIKRGK